MKRNFEKLKQLRQVTVSGKIRYMNKILGEIA